MYVEEYVGLTFNDIVLLAASDKISSSTKPDRLTFPAFFTLIVYVIISSTPLTPSPLSVIDAFFVTSITCTLSVITIVGSSSVLPSVSSPSSDVSETWADASLTIAVLDNPPESKSD